ncbi:MAG: hypothetical protein AAF230_10635, partial [Pseudomonadota bacterium]
MAIRRRCRAVGRAESGAPFRPAHANARGRKAIPEGAMRKFEYKAIPAPNTGTKAKGVKTTEDRFAR